MLKRFAGRDFHCPLDLQEQAQRETQRFTVVDLRGVNVNEDGSVDVLVNWEGFGSDHDTWEPALELFADLGKRLVSYLDANKKDSGVVADLVTRLQLKLQRRKKPRRKAATTSKPQDP